MPQKTLQVGAFDTFIREYVIPMLERQTGRSVSFIEAMKVGQPMWEVIICDGLV